MHKFKKVILDNGLNVVFVEDKKKNNTCAYLSVNTGGVVKDFYLDGKEYHLNYGIAHFLEHYLIESSIYGNSLKMFSDDYIDSNGLTALNRTIFYIATVHDFEENLVKLLNIVNNPKFDKDSFEKVKVPILREIEKCLDNPHRKANEDIFKSIFHKIPYDPTLGSKEDIINLDINDLKIFHKAFYNSKNETLVVAGNIDIDKIIKLIEKTYKEFNNNSVCEKIKDKEIDEVVNSLCNTTDTDNSLRITYKINISKFKPKEKDKLSYYMSFMLNNNFSDKTSFFKYIIENKISNYSIGKNFDFGVDKDYLVLSLIMYTDKFNTAKELLLDKMNNLEFTEDDFIKWKNKEIISKINGLENYNEIVRDYMDNVYLYDYYNYDDIKFIKKLNLDECIKYIDKLDLSNRVISISKRV